MFHTPELISYCPSISKHTADLYNQHYSREIWVKVQNCARCYSLSAAGVQDMPDWKTNISLLENLPVETCSTLSLSKKKRKTLLPLIEPSNTVSPFGKSTDSAGPSWKPRDQPPPLHLIPAKLLQKHTILFAKGEAQKTDCHPCIWLFWLDTSVQIWDKCKSK